MRFKDSLKSARDAFRLGLGMRLKDTLGIPNVVKGEVFLEMRDAATGALLHREHRKDALS